jgi:hypothetical protein
MNPIQNKNTNIHKIDAILTRVNIATIIAYKIWVNNKHILLFTGSTGIMFWYFLQSNIQSNKQWCSREHLYYHTLAHFACYVSLYLAFL